MFFLKSKFTLVLLLFGILSLAQSPSLSVECSSDQVLLGNSIVVEYHLSNLDGQFIKPKFENCEVMGPSISSQYQNINGEVSQKKSYSYVIRPLEEGTIVLPASEVHTKDDMLRSEEIHIKVKPNPDGIIDDIPNNGFFQEWSFDKKNLKEVEKPNQKKKRKRRKI